MKSFIPWMGGKSMISKDIVKMMPPHRCYVEVFGGGGWVLFAKPKHKTAGRSVEVYNDLNGELVNLFLVVRQDLDAFMKAFEWLPKSSREIFNRFKDEDPRMLNNIQRAVRFFYLIKNSVNAAMSQYQYSVEIPPKKLIYERFLHRVQLRLQSVYIENLPFVDLIPRYDSPDTFFYLDPPYVRHHNDRQRYVYFFRKKDHTTLRDILTDIKGKFILSYNDCEVVRKLYRDLNIKEVEFQYSAHRTFINEFRRHRVAGKELIITNFNAQRQSILATREGLRC